MNKQLIPNVTPEHLHISDWPVQADEAVVDLHRRGRVL